MVTESMPGKLSHNTLASMLAKKLDKPNEPLDDMAYTRTVALAIVTPS